MALLGEAGDEAKLLAGGQSLVPVLAYRLFRPTHVVDIDALSSVPSANGRRRARLGALVRHGLAREPTDGADRLLARAAGHIGHVPIRTRGTLGGSLAHADPAAELPWRSLALDARARGSVAAAREVAMRQFLLGPYKTSLEPGEMIVAVRSAHVGRLVGAFPEFALRSGDFALAAAGVV